MPRHKVDGGEGDSLTSSIRSKYAKNNGVHLGSDELLSDMTGFVSTQSATIDYAIGQPGIPLGKVTTIYGPEGSGKSLLGYHLLAEVQRIGGIGVLADTESRFTKDRAENVGINLNELIVLEGMSLEGFWDTLTSMIDDIREADADKPVVCVLDSLAEAVPEKRLKADVGDSLPANVARFVSQELPKLKMKISRHKIGFVVVNQLRSHVSFNEDPRSKAYEMRRKVMGPKNSMIGEWALLYGSALMLKVMSVSAIVPKGGDKDHPSGVRSRVINAKCGVSPHEGWRGEVEIDYLRGFDITASKLALALTLGFVTMNGTWYSFKGKNFRKEDFADVLRDNPELGVMLTEAPTLWKKGTELKPEGVVEDDDDDDLL